MAVAIERQSDSCCLGHVNVGHQVHSGVYTKRRPAQTQSDFQWKPVFVCVSCSSITLYHTIHTSCAEAYLLTAVVAECTNCTLLREVSVQEGIRNYSLRMI